MSLHQDIKGQMVVAMKAKDALRLNVIRGLLASFTNELKSKRRPDEPARTTEDVQSGGELSDEEILSVIGRAVKQRKDSIEQFEKGRRVDLAEVENRELAILETYLPAQMSRDEILAYVRSRQAELNMMSDLTKKNQFIGMIMRELKGKTDGAVVREIIDSIFSPDISPK